jgi:UDP-2,3-diacylglucosamine pyrophosphatase LpxH
LSPDEAIRLGAFFQSKTVTDCQQLCLVGDVVDMWICPHDVKPPTALDVLDAPHNRPVVDGIRAFAALPGRNVIWCQGNHDAGVDTAAARHLADNVKLVPRYNDEFPLRICHGHEDCLFNGPDPSNRPFPLGYFISRLVATAAARNLCDVGVNVRTFLKIGPDLALLLETEPLAEIVFDVVRKAADIKLEDRVVMPDGSTIAVGKVRADYQDLVSEWRKHRTTSVARALLCEADPYHDVPTGFHLNIAGHSHAAKVIEGHGYINLGSWCGKDAYFGKTWLEYAGHADELLCGALYKWENGVSTQFGKTVTVSTKSQYRAKVA